LHIGGARSALFDYLIARKLGGTFIVRSEDTDRERSSAASEQNILEALRWLHIDWDEGIDAGGAYGPYRQTERLALYGQYTERLLKDGKAYHCYCTEEELEAERRSQLARGETPRYIGACRHLTEEQRAAYEAAGRKKVVRFHVPVGEQLVVRDLIRGEVVFDSGGIGDFIIVKSDGIPVYNYAVVIDDITMNITHVIRGDEHLSNTPRQLVLYQALGEPAPVFGHVSLILNTEGHKMSKRDGDTAVLDYRAKGYLPEALVNFVVLLGWSPSDEREFFTLEELTEQFSLERVAKSPAVFDVNKLNYINAHYLKQADPDRLAHLALPYLREEGLFVGELTDEAQRWIRDFVQAVLDHLAYLAQVKEYIHYFTGSEVPAAQAEVQDILTGEQAPQVIRLFKDKIQTAEDLSAEAVKGIIKAVTKELKLSGKLVFMPLRAALTGQMHGPELYHIVSLLGRENVLRRLARY
jgi:nondiscriminating glutamyl-tRNA synthetase